MPEEAIYLNVYRKRLEFLDFSKVLAIFLVTVAHCAQSLSGEQFPTLFLSKDSFISVNMAIFMIASGFVMNIEKMRETNMKDFLFAKIIRLLIPMTSWYIVICIITLHFNLLLYWTYYWYLSALFVCLIVIKYLTNLFSRTSTICLISIGLLFFMPMIEFERSCYMIPFLWMGYALKKYIYRIGWQEVFLLLLLYVILYLYWSVSYSIYLSPFHIWGINAQMVVALLYRFIIGSVGAIALISLIRLLIDNKKIAWIRYLSQFGRYTLVFYTMSFVLNAILARLLWHVNVFITTPGILDIASVIISALMMVVMYCFQRLSEKNNIISLIFLGEYQKSK